MANDCMYYRWNAGYYCDLKYKKNGNGDISTYEVNHYCWYGRYEDCPLYKGRNGSGGCFLTSACVEAKGLPDDCHELTALRAFRDGYLALQPDGAAEISAYYHTAPQIVEKIKAGRDSLAVFDRVYEELVKPCVEMLDRGDNAGAHALYRAAVQQLQQKYLMNG